MLITSPSDILSKPRNFVIAGLREAGVSSSIGLYFYRFVYRPNPFIKIGECTRQEGIAERFSRGWHGTETYGDTYLRKKVKKTGQYVDSDFALCVQKISERNPVYFVFYEHALQQSNPKVDEMFAYRMHRRLFDSDTASPERMNSNPLLARRLVWHKSAFAEVVRCQFPDGTFYPLPPMTLSDAD